MLHGQTSYAGDFTVGVRKIQSGKLQHHSYLLSSKSVLITICVTVFQSQYCKMKVCVFLKTTVDNCQKQWQASY